jgi:hypothetical protein
MVTFGREGVNGTGIHLQLWLKILSPVLPFRCSLVSEGFRVSLTREGPLEGCPRLTDECPFEPRLVTFLLKKEGIPSSRIQAG